MVACPVIIHLTRETTGKFKITLKPRVLHQLMFNNH